jgi:hypothetical protein
MRLDERKKQFVKGWNAIVLCFSDPAERKIFAVHGLRAISSHRGDRRCTCLTFAFAAPT